MVKGRRRKRNPTVTAEKLVSIGTRNPKSVLNLLESIDVWRR